MFSAKCDLDAELAGNRFDVRALQEEQAEEYRNERRALRKQRAGTAVLGTSLVAGTAVAMLLLRLVVLYIEAYTLIKTERSNEEELISLCRSGSARTSAHMRAACLKAQIDQSSPIIFGALTKSTYALMREAGLLLSWPFKTFGLVSLCSVLGVLPWIETIRSLIFGNKKPAERAPEHSIFVLNPGDRFPGLTFQSLRSREKLLTPPLLDEGGFEEISLVNDKVKIN